jgi:hypothetical protein
VRRQGELTWELRSATSLYHRFTEGFDTALLQPLK